MDTTAALDTALSQSRAIWFIGAKIELPSHTVRVLDGAGEVTWSEGTFIKDDSIFGVLSSIEAITDGMDEAAPVLSMTFNPGSLADIVQLTNPAYQGSRARIWLGALNATTKAVVLDPYLLFDGVLDVPVLHTDMSTRDVEMTLASNFERLFMDDEGIRLNPANHKDVWPAETGLDDVTGVVRQVIWGPGDPIVGSAPGGWVPNERDYSGGGTMEYGLRYDRASL